MVVTCDLKLNVPSLVGTYELKKQIWPKQYGLKTLDFGQKTVSQKSSAVSYHLPEIIDTRADFSHLLIRGTSVVLNILTVPVRDGFSGTDRLR
jgi:hypothetical protein